VIGMNLLQLPKLFKERRANGSSPSASRPG